MDSPFSSGNLLADFAGKAETSHCTDNGAFPAVLSGCGNCIPSVMVRRNLSFCDSDGIYCTHSGS